MTAISAACSAPMSEYRNALCAHPRPCGHNPYPPPIHNVDVPRFMVVQGSKMYLSRGKCSLVPDSQAPPSFPSPCLSLSLGGAWERGYGKCACTINHSYFCFLAIFRSGALNKARPPTRRITSTWNQLSHMF